FANRRSGSAIIHGGANVNRFTDVTASRASAQGIEILRTAAHTSPYEAIRGRTTAKTAAVIPTATAASATLSRRRRARASRVACALAASAPAGLERSLHDSHANNRGDPEPSGWSTSSTACASAAAVNGFRSTGAAG